MNELNLLPQDKTYEQLLAAFCLPYFCYVLANMLSDVVALWMVYLIKIAIVTTVWIAYRKYYSFGKWRWRDIFISLLFTPVLLLLWAIPFYYYLSFTDSFSSQKLSLVTNGEIYWWLRTFASVILVAIFEEIFFRAYLLEYLHQSQQSDKSSIVDKCSSTLEEKPQDLSKIPLNLYSVVGTMIIFTLGHSTAEYISCVLYFTATLLIYKYLRSFAVCIWTHAFTNLGIAILVKYWGMDFLWFG
ncbi:CPBP family intramembrane glutamic endopeptidase [Candidatus Uabimicrobium amorphum]|uniref:CAAX prenyl protease 2/Lysostaphin resistance protein A-like domain-containing protein n=1 Tax=Uabimicrobium amorphum TaxID=2596890 RepID=A0A5S9INK2_UABAM|nr:CPBP family intramembrane glutamic endopeptidase [Candidatus Uabimicrobium amorphum]BBM84820.1 hypothetical protein UABAM_03181 [Candidatus Uabimicrobium amorphum]